MVHIDRIQLRYFKSFRNADITLSKGFVALAGPNGSGKSNICDGIRFVLGENSLKALRAKKVADLIYQGSEKAEIRLLLKEDGKSIELRRAIRRDGKTKYRYNGKRMTRTAVMDALRPVGAEIGEHNVIAQGEVEEIVKMSPKERREIIDSVSGVSEFEEKRNEAMRELEKVELKINDANIVLKEREGFLTELEKEKNDALRYNELNSELHRLRGSLISAELNRINEEHTQSLDRFLKLEKRINDAKKEMEYKRGQITELERQKNAIVDEINRRSRKDEAYREIEELRAALKVDSASLEAKKQELDESEGRLSAMEDEKKTVSKKLVSLQEEMKKMGKTLTDIAKSIETYETEKRSHMKNAGEAEANFAKLREELEKVLGELEAARLSESRIAGEISKEQDIKKLKEGELARLKSASSGESEKVGKINSEIEKAAVSIKELSGQIERLFEKERALNKELPELEKSWLKVRERISELSARIGPTAQSAGLRTVLEMRDKGEIKGIHGKVSELCKFKPEHAIAIEAAAGNRMDHVVVESFDVAAKAIERLKKLKSGRCTFIPLDRKKGEDVPIEVKSKGLGPLMDFVTFDARYKSAFAYVFGGTLLVQDVEAARKIGSGKTRMVTLDGDLFEMSGIITGGTFTPKLFLREKQELEELEGKASAMKSEREASLNELRRIREDMAEIRREKAEAEVKLKSLEIELANIEKKEEEENAAKKSITALEKEIAGMSQRIGKFESELQEAKKKISALDSRKASLKKMTEEGEKRDHEKKLTEIEAEIAEAKTKKSSLEATLEGKKTELGLVQEQVSANSDSMKSQKDRLAKMKKEIEQLGSAISANTEKLNEKEKAMKEASAAIEGLFAQRNEFEKSIGEVAVQVGKLEGSLERAMREMNEIAVKKATFETKLTDLKAEFEKYSDIKPIEAPKDELTAKVADHEQKLVELGNVNLRAPELYEERKRDIEEIKAKAGKLGDEKAAIMRVMGEIDGKKKTVFMETFNQVNDNFRKLFKNVFRGEGFLALDIPATPFESGLQIKVRDEKNEKHLESMSGGEKSLLTLLFVMSIHMYKPAPFYLLDEVEAALDKENSKKLADLVKGLSKGTQFIMVTHNDQVLSTADIALGVTRTAEGSKVVGVQLK